MNKRWILLCVSLLTLWSGCSKNPSGTDATSSGGAAAKAPKPECEDGKSPQVFEGASCPGAWKVQTDPKSGKRVCVFNYGPPITCPAGSKSTTYQAVCYGSVSKETAETPTDASQCESQFGKVPNPAPYRLACCPQ